jgi:hypothetical protein
MGQIKPSTEARRVLERMLERRSGPLPDDALTRMKVAFFDLWLDTEERPRIVSAHRTVHKLIDLHLGDTHLYRAKSDFIRLQGEIDRGLRYDKIDDIVIPAQGELREIYEMLFLAIFGVRPKKGE